MVTAQTCVYIVVVPEWTLCLPSMYCVVICLHSMHCVESFAGSLIILGVVNVLVDTRG